MKRIWYCSMALLTAGLTAALAVFYGTGAGAALSVAITLGITLYHVAMRLLVGLCIHGIYHNKMAGTGRWFREKPFERRLYRLLRVHRWKRWLPTWEKAFFDLQRRTPAEVVEATCQAEVVHELIAALSLLPMAMIPVWGAPGVILLTSVAAALVDLMFAVLQRYNRPRLLRLAERMQQRQKSAGGEKPQARAAAAQCRQK